MKFLSFCMVVVLFGVCSKSSAVPVYSTDAAGFIPYWIGLGNVYVSVEDAAGPALDTLFFPDEKQPMAAVGDYVTIGNNRLQWRAVTVAPGTPAVDINESLGYAQYAVAYLVTYLVMDKATSASLLWGSDDSGAVYVNGVEVGRHVGGRAVNADEDASAPFMLHVGSNTVVMKIINQQFGFGGCARLVDDRDMPLANVVISPVPPGISPPVTPTWPFVETGQAVPEGSIGCRLVVDHVGYLPWGDKEAIAVSKGASAWTEIDLVDAVSGKVALRVPQDGGVILPDRHDEELDEYDARVYFSAFHTPGRYYLCSNNKLIAKSRKFTISAGVFSPVAIQATRAFYFQTFGQAFTPQYAGRWAGPAYHDSASARSAVVYGYRSGDGTDLRGPVIDPKPRNVCSGWYDSGEPNEYTRDEALAQDELLLTYDMNKNYLHDGDLDIPQSGNGVLDLLDEARVGTLFLLEMQRKDGAVFDRVTHSLSPRGATRIAEPCSGATLCAAAGLAWAGAVWNESGKDPAFAKRCIAAAVKAWKYMQTHPSPWPLTRDHQPKDIGSFNGGYGDERGWKMLAAAALFRATGGQEYRDEIEPYLESLQSIRLGWNPLQIQACHNYALAKGCKSNIVRDFGEKMRPDALQMLQDVSKESTVYSYGAGCRDGYPWGSNGVVAEQASELAWYAWEFASPAEKGVFDEAAEEYLHYLLGRNPTDCCYLTNLQPKGVSGCPQVMDSFLNRGSDRWLTPSPGTDRVGCYPGFLLGGPMDGINNFGFQPDVFPTDYQRMGCSITYQAPMVCLTSYLAYGAIEALKQVK